MKGTLDTQCDKNFPGSELNKVKNCHIMWFILQLIAIIPHVTINVGLDTATRRPQSNKEPSTPLLHCGRHEAAMFHRPTWLACETPTALQRSNTKNGWRHYEQAIIQQSLNYLLRRWPQSLKQRMVEENAALFCGGANGRFCLCSDEVSVRLGISVSAVKSQTPHSQMISGEAST